MGAASAALRRRVRRSVARRLAAVAVGVALLVALAPRCSTLGAGHAGRSRTARRRRGATDQAPQQFGEEPILVAGPRARAADGRLPGLLLTEDLEPDLGLEGCLSGNLPRGAKAPAPVCAELAQTQADPGRLRPGHLHQRVGPPDRGPLRAERSAARAARPTRPPRRRARWPRHRDSARRSRTGSRSRRRLVARAVSSDALRPRRCATGCRGCRRHQRPRLRAEAGVRAVARASTRQSRASPTCSRAATSRADPGAAARRAERDRAAARRSTSSARRSRAPRSSSSAATTCVSGEPVRRAGGRVDASPGALVGCSWPATRCSSAWRPDRCCSAR